MQLLAGIALAIGLLLSLFNWASILLSRPEKHVSPIPLLGGIFLAVGFLGFEWDNSNYQLRITNYAGGRQLTVQLSAETYVLAETDPDDDGPSI